MASFYVGELLCPELISARLDHDPVVSELFMELDLDPADLPEFFGVHELFVVLSGVYFVSTGLSGLIVASLNTAGQQAFGSILLP